MLLKRKVDDSQEFDSNDNNAVYFLSKAGNVVATDMQRSPSKQYSSIMTVKDGEEIAYFLSSSGTIVACNLTHKCFFEYPRLLPVFYEYSIDVVECRGEMLVVLLSEFFGSASLRVWRFDEEFRSWHQIAAMPPAMSHEFYGKKVDINCVGAGDQIFICLNSAEFFSYILCDLRTNDWVELPKCFMNGEAVEFMSAFSFEPRIEASGHLTVDPEPPQPQWLVQPNLMSSMASLLGAESSGAPVENAANILEELISNLDTIIPEIMDNESRVSGAPPASKEVVANLSAITLTKEILARLGQYVECAICKENLVVDD
ncbi:hypothetical protein GH714_037811 [Hevea brasiliensis]|uniref:F-box associated domain-containing protein n=1 Tax=Hevea brasiliensis TaxID=3981 RepID=A0A6A6K8I2_HEVBR|nr:hypothetical protein GH714_037811 [Hevea brasiliensis]